MTTHYGNQSNSSDKIRLHYGQQSTTTFKDKHSIETNTDCITCQMHNQFKLPLASNNKPYKMCMATCNEKLMSMERPFLINMTRAQLMVKYPNIGLTIRMDKATMIMKIEIYLLQVDLELT